MRSRQVLRVILLLLALSPSATLAESRSESILSDQPLSLQSAIELAIKHNSELESARQRVIRAKAVRGEIIASALPTLDVESSFQVTDEDLLPAFDNSTFGSDRDWQAAVVLRQPIYSGGANIAKNRFSKRTMKAAEFELHSVMNQTLGTIRERFYNVLLQRDQVQVQKESVRLLEKEEVLAKNRLQAGTVSEFEVLRAEVAVANSRPALIRAQNEYRIALMELGRAIGTDEDMSVRPPNEVKGELVYYPFSASLDELLSTAHKNHPEVYRLSLLVEASEQEVKFERSRYLPAISAYGSYNSEKSQFSDDIGDSLEGWRAGVDANWNLFNSFGTNSRVDAALANVVIAKQQLQQAKLDVEIEVRRAHSSLREATELVTASKRVAERAKESVRLASNRYNAGVVTQLDVLQAKFALTQAKSNQIQALYDYNVAITRLHQAVGDTLALREPKAETARRGKTRARLENLQLHQAGPIR